MPSYKNTARSLVWAVSLRKIGSPLLNFIMFPLYTVAKRDGDRFIKKSAGNRKEAIFSRTKNEAKYLAIKELHKEKEYSIHWMCKRLGLRRSAYYKWLNRPIPENEQEDMKLSETVMDYYQKYGGSWDIVECAYLSIEIIINTIMRNGFIES